MFRIVAAFFVLAITLFGLTESHSNPQRRHHSSYRNNNRNRDPPPEGLFWWTRDLGRHRQSHEYAFVPPGSQLVYAESTDDILSSLNIQPSSSFYDFTNAVPIDVLAPEDGPCYYTNTTLNLGQTIDNLNTINNTVIPTVNELPLDGTAVPLTPAQVQNLLGAYPNLGPVCAGRDIIPAYPPGAAPVPYLGPTRIIQVFTLASSAHVTVRRPTRDSYRRRHRHDSHGRHRHHRH